MSFIELDAPDMSAEQMCQLELLVNEKIKEGVRMYPTLYASKDDPEIQDVSISLSSLSCLNGFHESQVMLIYAKCL